MLLHIPANTRLKTIDMRFSWFRRKKGSDIVCGKFMDHLNI
jgi:hypothetical protein